MLRLVLKFIAVTGLILSSALIAVADDKPDPPLITVTGEAEVNVVPDEVVFDVTIQTFHRDLHQAKTLTDNKLKGLIALTRRYGIAPENVQTDYIKLEPRFKGNDEARTFLGYSVRKDVVFTLKDVSKAEGLLSEILEGGVTRLNSVRFQTSQLRKYRDQARASAITAAREKAMALTAAIGQTIGKAYSIEEDVPQRGYASQNTSYTSNSSLTVDGDSASSEGTLSLGQIKVNARVTVRFELK